MDSDEKRYADDTICVAQDKEAMNRLVKAIEDKGRAFGVKLNRTTCEYLSCGNTRKVQFGDGTKVPRLTQAKYLVCNLNDKGDPERELNKRRQDSMATLNKLHIFLQHRQHIRKANPNV